jgi:cytochrome c-type biogenesis protein CcmE
MNKLSIIVLLIVAIGLGFIVANISDFSQDTTFSTAAAKPSKSFQVVGYLDTTKTMEYDAIKNPNYFAFHVKDKEGNISKVEFAGAKPQDFERAESVTLTGKMENGSFKCSKILTKCPSKYNNDKAFEAKDQTYTAQTS